MSSSSFSIGSSNGSTSSNNGFISTLTKSSKESLQNSPSLPPRPPRPSPARSASNGLNSNQSFEQGSAKRKINWDLQSGSSTEGFSLSTAAAGDTASSTDSGVKVIVRMRPLNKKEETEEAEIVLQKTSVTSVSIADQHFTYDAVAGQDASQQAVFEMVGLPMVENCLAGFNSSIFAYGQTGSGKTHTMWGAMPDSNTDLSPSADCGLTPRVFERLFARIRQEEEKNTDKQLWYQCRCSFLEIYHEQIMDLLEPSQKNLMIREDTKTGIYVDGLTEEYVSNVKDVMQLLIKGLANRRVGETTMNRESSRSHIVFTCVIECRSKSVGEGLSSVRSSRMNLVDLAGSERQKQTGAAGDRLKEAGNINKSLSQLGNVINILAEVAQSGKQRHIPYRDSRLTFLLQESLGGNAKLAMICAVSPASSCKSETLGTLRFAQRAKAMQNKAVINEEKANDVNLLREQIRQLKDELTRMKMNSSQPAGNGSGYSNSWNARRSYNLLRLSLGHPMTFPIVDSDDNDEEMEIDDETVDSEPVRSPAVVTMEDMTMEHTELSNSMEVVSKEARRSSLELEHGSGIVLVNDVGDDDSPNIELNGTIDTEDITKKHTDLSKSMEMPGTSSLGKGSGSRSVVVDVGDDDDSPNVDSPAAATSEDMTRKDEELPNSLAMASKDVRSSNCEKESRSKSATVDTIGDDESPNIDSPTLGVMETPRTSLPALNISAIHDLPPSLQSPTCTHSPKELLVRLEEKIRQPPMFGLSALEEDCTVLDSLPKVPFAESSSLRSSLHNSKSFASPRDRLAASLHRGLQILDNHQNKSHASGGRSSVVRFSFQSADLKATKTVDKGAQTLAVGCTCNCTLLSNSILSNVRSSFQKLDLKKTRSSDAGTQTSPQRLITSEAVLAGSIRRERAVEEAMMQQAAEIEQLNRLVRQYKNERECNSVLQQSREDKILRLEALMGGVLPSDIFLTEEWQALLHEHKTLQEKFDKHPEVTHAKVEQERLLDELERYRTFFDFGEREVLLQEIQQLRNHLQTHLECGTLGAKHRRLSLTSKALRGSTADLSKSTALCTLPEATSSCGLSAVEHLEGHLWEKEQMEWEEREIELLTIVEDLREEADSYKQLSERRKLELDGEKRCAKEVHEALEMAMEGHARLLEQYAELQEKHIGLLSKNRKIREGVTNLKKLAKKAGVTATETRWFESQAEQLVAMRIDHEHERDAAKDEVEGLKMQLQDTADAVQAAGELLVRLKEAEDAVCMAQDAAAMAGQEANTIRREMEKMTQKHARETATLQQRLLEASMQKASLCPMCIMAERVKFEFNEVDTDAAEAEAEAEALAKTRKEDCKRVRSQRLGWNSGEGLIEEEDEEESITGEHEGHQLPLENLDIDEFVDEIL
ncbi:unnamed protein product [Sphagnum troendelagicum]